MNPKAAGANITPIIDISHYQTTVNWNTIKNGTTPPVGAVIMKATEGSNIQDPTFTQRWAACKNSGIFRGAYHYFKPNEDVGQQVQFFLNAIGTLAANDFPPILDWEETDNTQTSVDVSDALQWLNLVQKATKKTPIVYGNPSFLQALNLPLTFAGYPLWIAEYGVNAPKMPSPWSNWLMWQYDESGTIPGVSGACDVDLFNGSMADLGNYLTTGHVPNQALA